jgi:predicted LPLAT superfamily acyltransferase
MLQQVGVPTFLQNFAPSQVLGNVAQRGLGLVYGEMNQRMASELAEAMMNPQRAAELMQLAQGNPQVQQLLANALRSSAVAGAVTPAIAQGQQQ